LAGELLEKETLHRAELEAIFSDVKKRPRLTMFDDFGGRIPSDKPPIKTPGELAIERGEEWPKPVPEPAFKAAIAQASKAAADASGSNGSNGSATNGTPAGPTQPDYGAPAGWHAPGWPPQNPQGPYQPQGWYPPPPPPPPPGWQPPYPPYQPYPYPGQQQRPHGGQRGAPAPNNEDAGQESNRPDPPSHG
jgi:cell division protease FtsH